MTIRAVVFDAYGTLWDVLSVRDVATRLCGETGDLVTQLWRLKQLEYSWLRALMQDYADFWQVTRAALEFALAAAGLAPEARICEPLMERYRALDLYPDAGEALRRLDGCACAILSNGTPGMLEALARRSGIAPLLARIISVDAARTYKPDPRCYALVEPALGVPKAEVLFVSANHWDVAGARRFGFTAAWLARDPAPGAPAGGPADFYRLQRGRAERLGYEADLQIRTLAELPEMIAARQG